MLLGNFYKKSGISHTAGLYYFPTNVLFAISDKSHSLRFSIRFRLNRKDFRYNRVGANF